MGRRDSGRWAVRDDPFRHRVVSSVLDESLESSLLTTLETIEWETRFTDFYRFSIPRDDGVRHTVLAQILEDLQLEQDLDALEELFGCRLTLDAQLEIQRYEPGSGIGAHTDLGTPEVRYVINLNRSWKKEDGGIWILAQDSTLERQAKYLPSFSNTGFFFCTGKASFHAISQYFGRQMFVLVIRIPRI